MRNNHLPIITVFCSLLIALVTTGCKSEDNSAKIVFEIRPEVNYVTHLYTLAGLGFSDEEYSAKYAGTLPEESLDTLRKYKDYLTFGQGEGGFLAGPFFFEVSANPIANTDSLRRLMDKIVEEGVNAGVAPDVMTVVHSIAEVYVDNYDSYLRDIYPQVKEDLRQRTDELNKRFKKNSIVKDWERVTGYTWNRGDYHWLLYRAGENGPSYNNLNTNTNTVYYNQPIDLQVSMFSHEFGIFLMQDAIEPIYAEMKEMINSMGSENDLTFVPWSAFESLACWFNRKIAGEETEDFRNFEEADVQTFSDIFDKLSAQGISDPADLYRQGVLEYLKTED